MMMIKTNKTKEFITCFGKKVNIDIPAFYTHGNDIDRVTIFYLSWDNHVTDLLQKVAKRMYCNALIT